RGGGGYDHFPQYARKQWGVSYHQQFIAQLFGCNLDCPYCYVTRAGVWGKYQEVTTEALWQAFEDSGQQVFHLMGGAPAIYMKQWPELLARIRVQSKHVFHSDLMLTEHEYDRGVLRSIRHQRALYAVNIKGTTAEEHLRLTRKPLNVQRMHTNLRALLELEVPFYVTFTGVKPEQAERWARFFLPYYIDWYVIDLIEYDALPFVDEVVWGRQVKVG
ncbi:MAG: radical SAM protein, partial [Dehalococcoidia bacterium]|nr:radical SAM protein [Dehalococcoidia bacterium]